MNVIVWLTFSVSSPQKRTFFPFANKCKKKKKKLKICESWKWNHFELAILLLISCYSCNDPSYVSVSDTITASGLCVLQVNLHKHSVQEHLKDLDASYCMCVFDHLSRVEDVITDLWWRCRSKWTRLHHGGVSFQFRRSRQRH